MHEPKNASKVVLSNQWVKGRLFKYNTGTNDSFMKKKVHQIYAIHKTNSLKYDKVFETCKKILYVLNKSVEKNTTH